MRRESVYNSKNIFLLIGIFAVIFSLLYALASFLHEKQKIDNEILAIREENQKYLLEIEEKERYLEYLKTPQRIDKEAKIQIGKKQPGEQVLVFIEQSQIKSLEDTIKTEVELFDPAQIQEPTISEKWIKFFSTQESEH